MLFDCIKFVLSKECEKKLDILEQMEPSSSPCSKTYPPREIGNEDSLIEGLDFITRTLWKIVDEDDDSMNEHSPNCTPNKNSSFDFMHGSTRTPDDFMRGSRSTPDDFMYVSPLENSTDGVTCDSLPDVPIYGSSPVNEEYTRSLENRICESIKDSLWDNCTENKLFNWSEFEINSVPLDRCSSSLKTLFSEETTILRDGSEPSSSCKLEVSTEIFAKTCIPSNSGHMYPKSSISDIARPFNPSPPLIDWVKVKKEISMSGIDPAMQAVRLEILQYKKWDIVKLRRLALAWNIDINLF